MLSPSNSANSASQRIVQFPPPPSPKHRPNKSTRATTTTTTGTTATLTEQDMDIVRSDDELEGVVGSKDGDVEVVEGQDRETDLDGHAREEVLSPGAEQEVDADSDLPLLHVEVRLLPNSVTRRDLLKNLLHTHLNNEYETLLTNSEVWDWTDVRGLEKNVERLWIAECSLPTLAVPLTSVSLQIHLYQPYTTASSSSSSSKNPSSSSNLFLTSSPSDRDDDDDSDSDGPASSGAAASLISLPNVELDGVWDNLVYEDDVKGKLLGYIYSTILFSDSGVDFNVVSWNRVVLLHGPPGTGKTSLCRALAQKLSIRLSERYPTGKLIEINSHSLFSKWFSESGKLVQKLFSQINDLLREDQDQFVVVLIDEVESLTAARAGAMSGKEPSDALRVVNALLTQLDKLKTKKNCLIMTTSNLTGAIDNAFIDRADIKQYIGLPPPQAVYWILQSCLKEIVRAGLSPFVNILSWPEIELLQSMGSGRPDVADEEEVASREASESLYKLAHACQGMSGRSLRRLPVLAHAHFIRNSSNGMKKGGPSMMVWLKAMMRCATELRDQMELIEKS